LVADPKCAEFRRFGDDGKGAWVNVVGWAESADKFHQKLIYFSGTLDCLVTEFQKVQLLENRLEEDEIPDELFTMKSTAIRQPGDMIFGSFHIWTQSDIN